MNKAADNASGYRLTIHNPVLCRERAADVTVVTVRDGMNNRRYYLGTPQQVCQRCSQIYDGSARDMTREDRARIEETAAGIALENGRVLAWATALEEEAPIFLGMAALGDELHRPALQDAATLRGMGLTLMLDAGTQGADELAALRELMNLPEHHARADLQQFRQHPSSPFRSIFYRITLTHCRVKVWSFRIKKSAGQ